MTFVPVKGKGATLSISGTVAAITSLDLPEIESETAECDTLDNASAWIPYMATGRSEPGKISGEALFSPAAQAAITALITTPPTPGSEPTGTITFASGASVSFKVAGASYGGSVALKEPVKAKFSLKLTGTVTYSGGST